MHELGGKRRFKKEIEKRDLEVDLIFMHEIVNIKKKKKMIPSRIPPKNSVDLLNFFVLFFSELF